MPSELHATIQTLALKATVHTVALKATIATGQGPAGPPGSGGGGATTKLSIGPISGGMVVRYVDATHVAPASADNVAHVNLLAGIALSATSAAEQELQVVRQGEITDSSWTWTPGLPLYLSPTGVLTQVHSESWSFAVIVAVALSATRIAVDFRDPIIQE